MTGARPTKFTTIDEADCAELQSPAQLNGMTHAEMIAAFDTLGADAARFRWMLSNTELALDIFSLAIEQGQGKIDTANRFRESIDRARNVRPAASYGQTLTKTAAQGKKR